MKIDILTLFPEMFEGIFSQSIIKRAILDKKVEIKLLNFRDYSKDPHHKVDDTPYGGGSGMVLTCQPIFDCVEALKEDDSLVILMTPDGIPYKQQMAYDLSKKKHLIIICGHYEGFDERIRSLCDLEISIGDYVLTGGELPAMVLIDSISRQIEGVLKKDSILEESFSDGILEYPQYTRPEEFNGKKVPDVLVSGHHENIKKWRRKEALKNTFLKRPELLENKKMSEEDIKIIHDINVKYKNVPLTNKKEVKN